MQLKRAAERARIKINKSLQTRGVSGTLIWAARQVASLPRTYLRAHSPDVAGQAFDASHHVDTAGKVELLHLDISSPNLAYGTLYQACSPEECRQALAHLPLDRAQDFTFIDFGCGKGRALMIASEQRFGRIVGLDFSPELCEIARRNQRALRAGNPAYPSWEIVCGDAAEYSFSPEPTVLYLYNPFDDEVMKRVARNVAATVEQSPREFFVVYLNAKHPAAWEANPRFRLVHQDAYCRIYSAAP
jgi:SAM-dependent methyltransferase